MFETSAVRLSRPKFFLDESWPEILQENKSELYGTDRTHTCHRCPSKFKVSQDMICNFIRIPADLGAKHLYLKKKRDLITAGAVIYMAGPGRSHCLRLFVIDCYSNVCFRAHCSMSMEHSKRCYAQIFCGKKKKNSVGLHMKKPPMN